MAATKRGKKRQRHQKQAAPSVIYKKKWVDMEMYRVPLDHTQAVLTCCDASGRVEVVAQYTLQCLNGYVVCGLGTNYMSS